MTRIGDGPWWGVWVAACICLAAVCPPAAAQTTIPCDRPVLTSDEAADLLRLDRATLERLASEGAVPGRRVGTAWRFACTALIDWLHEGADTGTTSAPDGPAPLAIPDLQEVLGRGLAGQAGGAADQPPDSGRQVDAPIGEAPEERTAEDVFLRDQRVLLGPGDVVVDIGQFYFRRDDLQLTSVGGAVALATLEQRALTTFVVGRVGVFSETEVFASTSFNRVDSRQFIGGATLDGSDDAAFGATALGVRRTLLREGAGRPDVILTLSGQFETDTAPAALGGGLVVVKSLDPVVLFASTSYFRTLETEAADQTRIPPVDVVDVSMGYGLGLNDTVAISTAVSGRFAGTTTVQGVTVRPPSSFSARFGLTAWLAEGLYIEPSVSFGLSGPGDAFAFGVTLPYAF